MRAIDIENASQYIVRAIFEGGEREREREKEGERKRGEKEGEKEGEREGEERRRENGEREEEEEREERSEERGVESSSSSFSSKRVIDFGIHEKGKEGEKVFLFLQENNILLPFRFWQERFLVCIFFLKRERERKVKEEGKEKERTVFFSKDLF